LYGESFSAFAGEKLSVDILSAYKSGIVQVRQLTTRDVDEPIPKADIKLADIKLAQALENASAQQDLNKSLLRLTFVLQQRKDTSAAVFCGLSPADLQSQSVIALLMAQPTLLESLRKAHQGNYGVILSLLGCLDHGLQAKKLVDRVIDACRFSIILHPSISDLVFVTNITATRVLRLTANPVFLL